MSLMAMNRDFIRSGNLFNLMSDNCVHGSGASKDVEFSNEFFGPLSIAFQTQANGKTGRMI